MHIWDHLRPARTPMVQTTTQRRHKRRPFETMEYFLGGIFNDQKAFKAIKTKESSNVLHLYLSRLHAFVAHCEKKSCQNWYWASYIMNQTLLGILSGFFLEPRVAPGSNFDPSMVFLASKEVSPKIFLLWNGLLSYNTSFILKWPNYWNALHRKWKLNTVRRIKSREIM